MSRSMIVAAAVVVSMTGSAQALAQSAGWYGGASIGESKTSDDLVANREASIVNGFARGSSFDGKDTAVRIFGGYRFSPWISLEANYSDLGKTTLTTTTVANEGGALGTYNQRRSVSGWGAGLVVSAPVWERGSVFARVSAQQARTKADVNLAGDIGFTDGNTHELHRSTTSSETIAAYAVGAEWMLNPVLGVRLEWERWPKVGKAFTVGSSGGATGEADMDFYSLGLLYRF